jgi:exopolyphosphatase/guanosine-5'-triphosphate,3'-diphosphate pyrophosphatase
MGALLHDVGRVVNAQAHHKHGEYLVRHADIPGLGKHQQIMVACLVRYHGKATPEPHHRQYRSLAPLERQRVRQLAGLLQIAVALDSGDTQAVRRLEVKIQKDDVRVRIFAPPEAFLDFRELRRKARLLEKECSVRLRFDRGRWADRANRAEQPNGRRAALARRTAA